VTYRLAPPTLGEHTDEVLHDLLGLEAPALEALRTARII
jgi:crotonobetainyl-CoA:carnitine CoA-transferase CaiB-like acyl-CoA transferase